MSKSAHFMWKSTFFWVENGCFRWNKHFCVKISIFIGNERFWTLSIFVVKLAIFLLINSLVFFFFQSCLLRLWRLGDATRANVSFSTFHHIVLTFSFHPDSSICFFFFTYIEPTMSMVFKIFPLNPTNESWTVYFRFCNVIDPLWWQNPQTPLLCDGLAQHKI